MVLNKAILTKDERVFLDSFQRTITNMVVEAVDMNHLSLSKIWDLQSRLDAYSNLVGDIYAKYVDPKTKKKLADYFNIYATSTIPACECDVNPRTLIGDTDIDTGTIRVYVELFSKASEKKVYSYEYNITYPTILN